MQQFLQRWAVPVSYNLSQYPNPPAAEDIKWLPGVWLPLCNEAAGRRVYALVTNGCEVIGAETEYGYHERTERKEYQTRVVLEETRLRRRE